MERTGDVLAAGLLEVADPALSSNFFVPQVSLDISSLDCFFFHTA